jgi:hypothetical protein
MGILDEDIYNFDKTSYLIGLVNGLLIIIPINTKEIYIDDPENRELIMSTEYISASNYYIPPIITFKDIYYLYKYIQNDTDSNIFWT